MSHRDKFSDMVTNTVKMIEKKLDLSEIDNIEFDGIDYNDYPDYCDAFVCSADYKGVAMTDTQLDNLNENYRDFVYDKLINYLF